MAEQEPNPALSVAERIKDIYPDYMATLRYLVDEGRDEYNINLERIIQPDERYLEWSRRASLGNKYLVLPIAQLGSASAEANKVHLLPQIYDINWEVGEKWQAFDQIDCFHLLRLFANDCRLTREAGFLPDGASLHPIFYVDPTDVRG